MTHIRTKALWRTITVGAAVLAAFGLSRVASADGVQSLRLTGGRLTGASPTTPAVEAGQLPAYGATYDVVGRSDASLAGPGGLVLRALPGTRLRAEQGSGGVLAVTLERGSFADAAAASPFEVVSSAGRIRSEGARFSARSTPDGLYVEHRAGSPGRLIVTPFGGTPSPLPAGSFRMMGLVATASSPVVPATASAAAPACAPLSYALPAPRVLPATLVSEGQPAVASAGAYDPNAPVPMHPCSPNCGAMLRTPPPAVPVRADDFGRVPLGSALSGGPCCNRADVECNRIPYVRYVEGLVCDVATYKLGYRLVTVRPASRVRVHRLPDGSLQLWAPNIGKDLALIELDWNQFCFIGEDGFLVLSADGQIEYFRGLVHLYHQNHEDCLFKVCRQYTPPRNPGGNSPTPQIVICE